MNRVILIGRLTKDPEVRFSQDGKGTARYTLAIPRPVAQNNAQGQQETDFVQCVVFGKGVEFAERYLKKGMRIAIEGHIRTGSYTRQDGQKVYTTDVVIDRHEFCEGKAAQEQGQYTQQVPTQQMPPQQVMPQAPYQAAQPQNPYPQQAPAPQAQVQASVQPQAPAAGAPQVPDTPYLIPDDLPFS